MTGGAIFDVARTRRFRLWRDWSPSGGRIAWVMVNPSMADSKTDDPTIRRVIGFSTAWGYGGIDVVNLSPWIDTYNARPAHDERNVHAIRRAFKHCRDVVVAWGTEGEDALFFPAVRDVCALLAKRPSCLGVNANGSPKHPLYLRADAERMPWPGWARYRLQESVA
jgi:hypothetical protein